MPFHILEQHNGRVSVWCVNILFQGWLAILSVIRVVRFYHCLFTSSQLMTPDSTIECPSNLQFCIGSHEGNPILFEPCHSRFVVGLVRGFPEALKSDAAPGQHSDLLGSKCCLVHAGQLLCRRPSSVYLLNGKSSFRNEGCGSTTHLMGLQAWHCGRSFATNSSLCPMSSMWKAVLCLSHRYRLSHFVVQWVACRKHCNICFSVWSWFSLARFWRIFKYTDGGYLFMGEVDHGYSFNVHIGVLIGVHTYSRGCRIQLIPSLCRPCELQCFFTVL